MTHLIHHIYLLTFIPKQISKSAGLSFISASDKSLG